MPKQNNAKRKKKTNHSFRMKKSSIKAPNAKRISKETRAKKKTAYSANRGIAPGDGFLNESTEDVEYAQMRQEQDDREEVERKYKHDCREEVEWKRIMDDFQNKNENVLSAANHQINRR